MSAGPSAHRAFVGLGSNLDDPARQVGLALAAIAELPQTDLRRASRLYANPPMGPQDQPNYVNAVAEVSTALAPLELLDGLLSVERRQGRRREGNRWGPRRIDLDLLLFDDVELAEPRLSLPHPGLPERAFVLYPLAEIAPTLVVPGHGSIQLLLEQVDPSGLRPLAPAEPIDSGA